jgi:hypothetical protein
MRWITAIRTIALAVCTGIVCAQTVPNAQQPAAPSDSQSPSDGLKDLDAMTLSCPKAALNAAAREATKVHSLGTYQFAYSNIITGSHHARYEVHFKSNYVGEPDLKYCVELYCQQGWDPGAGNTSVTLMSASPQSTSAASHMASCTEHPGTPRKPAKRPAGQ